MKRSILAVLAGLALVAAPAASEKVSAEADEGFEVPEGFGVIAPRGYIVGSSCNGMVMVSERDVARKLDAPICRVI